MRSRSGSVSNRQYWQSARERGDKSNS
jgi:hypothetical protein